MYGDNEFALISAYFSSKVKCFIGLFYKHQETERLQKLNKFIEKN
ncbi:hypothetical protein CRYPD_244 [uncultured Candidatus Thioglobus sp.]|nr:hypothetical protein CRYPD_244 [uncultured Candidatus Thioglobus sp.]